jgi:phosphoglucosamine mutase
MRAGGFNVGGEQSGHVILSDFTTTGDGLICALQVLAAMVEAATGLRDAALFEPLPQRLRNVRYAPAPRRSRPGPCAATIAEAEAALGGAGRLVIRPSGTEPVIRVMAEAEDAGARTGPSGRSAPARAAFARSGGARRPPA